MDAEHGTALSLAVARRLGQTLVAPTVRIGCSEHHLAFAGTISLRQETFAAVVTDYVTSLVHHGFDRILIIPSHGGNFGPLAAMMADLQAAAGTATVATYTDFLGLISLWREETEAELGLGERIGGHADIGETAIMLALEPELVRQDLAAEGWRGELNQAAVERIIRDGLDSVTPNGILGDARGATAALGARLIDALAATLVDHFSGLA